MEPALGPEWIVEIGGIVYENQVLRSCDIGYGFLSFDFHGEA